MAGDPDILSDFAIPLNCSCVNGKFFTYTIIQKVLGSIPSTCKVTKESLTESPSLNGRSESQVVLQFLAGTVNPLHTHQRSAKLLFQIDSTLEVRFVDTKNVHYIKTLKVGDIFVFLKGLVHYQYNRNHNLPATAILAFGSASVGTVSVPLSVFATGIKDVILDKSFETDVTTVEKIKT